ncbi:probable ATP-dependent RNA helicase Dbp73D [Drosophila sulfurigaster albostrigata]|uniref:probable ATP-dependent RNA helicase Dbp73D n=1 Tax=Drosophila sulfurigaster albostrigata TaxID=89887 RepID=UPI002D21B76A|nr:probable ATP-dependent RNA helicase Dbp73D [Drosophila sulfurigaster albostrigata]
MELFTVNRYTEDHKKSKGSGETANEDAILQKLLQKAEKRKRKHKSSEPEKPQESVEDIKEPEAKEDTTQDEVATEPTEETAPTEEVDSNDFQVIGSTAKKQKVEMFLPAWLAHPTIIEGGNLIPDGDADAAGDDEASIKQLSYLEKSTLRALKQMKIKRLFPVQRAVIPWVLEAQSKPEPFRPRDICVSAPTGSGKTLAFAIPIVQMLANRVECKVRALVVLPVAELALQVFKVFSVLCSHTELQVCLLSKQHRLEDEQKKMVEQYKGAYYSKVDIVVTTPGRLVDHLHATKGFCLKSLQFLVIDEADRIMDAVFQNWLYHLDSHVRSTADQLLAGVQAPLCYQELLDSYGKQPHKLLFSATLSQDPEKLQNLRLFQPKLFTTVLTLPTLQPKLENGEQTEQDVQQSANQFIGKYTTPAELTELHCLTEMRYKPLTLYALVQQYGWKRFLCFTNSADTADRLGFVLSSLFKDTSIHVAELSSKMSVHNRKVRLSQFMRGGINGLICSDALARGIDVPNVDIVVSYDAPRHIKTYIHRVGRTARAGQKGTAVTLLTDQDQQQFKKMLNEVGKSLGDEITTSPDLELQHAGIYKTALELLRRRQENQKKDQRVEKIRKSRKANLHKQAGGADGLTLMEKLQLKAIDDLADEKPKEEPKQPKPKAKKVQKRKIRN